MHCVSISTFSPIYAYTRSIINPNQILQYSLVQYLTAISSMVGLMRGTILSKITQNHTLFLAIEKFGNGRQMPTFTVLLCMYICIFRMAYFFVIKIAFFLAIFFGNFFWPQSCDFFFFICMLLIKISTIKSHTSKKRKSYRIIIHQHMHKRRQKCELNNE